MKKDIYKRIKVKSGRVYLLRIRIDGQKSRLSVYRTHFRWWKGDHIDGTIYHHEKMKGKAVHELASAIVATGHRIAETADSEYHKDASLLKELKKAKPTLANLLRK